MASSPEAIVDTVVLRYFLLIERIDLLVLLLGAPIGVPRVVYDPDDDTAPLAQRSELRASVERQLQRSRDLAFEVDERALSAERSRRLTGADDLHDSGQLIVLDLDEAERKLAAQLTSPSGCNAFGLKFPLHPGEAACLALVVHRGLTLVTDDNDALTAAKTIDPMLKYERIRKLLIRAADQGLLTHPEANRLHREMTDERFRDNQLPFPDE